MENFAALLILSLCVASHALPVVNEAEFDSAEYLKKYGYLGEVDRDGMGYEGALCSFQEFNSLPVTCTLDRATLAVMSTARCGLPDLNQNDNRYNIYPRRWTVDNLTWRVNQYTNDLGKDEIDSILTEAWETWSDVSSLSFTRVTDSSASVNIDIDFFTGSHGDRYDFDGANGVLAHAFFPTTGDVHFDDDETFRSCDKKRSGCSNYSLKWVAVHEFGHSLGLDHSDDGDAVMYPYYGVFGGLNDDDIRGIQSIYGV